MKILYVSKIGNRKNNEDNILIDNKIVRGEDEIVINNKDNLLLIVADGMGGCKNCEVVTDIIFKHLINNYPTNKQELEIALKQARDEVENFALKHNIKLGSALAGIFKVKNKLIIFNIGDCRVYRKIFNNFILLTKDHTMIEQLIEDGIIKKEDSKKYNNIDNILTSAISSDVKKFDIYFNETKLLNNDKFLICSDGFWKEFENEFIEIFNYEKPLQKLKELSYKKFLKDNYSFIYVEN
jgi:serine/threonine protein phosphatase PrpC